MANINRLQYALKYFTPEQKSPSFGLFVECIQWIRRQPDHSHVGWASHHILIPRLDPAPPYDSSKYTRIRDSKLHHTDRRRQSIPTPGFAEVSDQPTLANYNKVDSNNSDHGQNLDNSYDVDSNDDDDDGKNGLRSFPSSTVSIATSYAQRGPPPQPQGSKHKRKFRVSNSNTGPIVESDSDSHIQDTSWRNKKQNKGKAKISLQNTTQDQLSEENPSKPLRPSFNYAESSSGVCPNLSSQSQDITSWQTQLKQLQQRLTQLESNLCSLQNNFPETSRYLILDSLTTPTPLHFSGDAKADADLYLTRKRTDFRLFLHLYGLDPTFVARLQNPLAIYIINTYATHYRVQDKLRPAFEVFLTHVGRILTTLIGQEYMDIETAHAARAFLDVLDTVLTEEAAAAAAAASG